MGETTVASATPGSPTENRAIGTGFTSRADPPLVIDTTRSAWVTTRWAWRVPAKATSRAATDAIRARDGRR